MPAGPSHIFSTGKSDQRSSNTPVSKSCPIIRKVLDSCPYKIIHLIAISFSNCPVCRFSYLPEIIYLNFYLNLYAGVRPYVQIADPVVQG
jgi:hypothetical protein